MKKNLVEAVSGHRQYVLTTINNSMEIGPMFFLEERKGTKITGGVKAKDIDILVGLAIYRKFLISKDNLVTMVRASKEQGYSEEAVPQYILIDFLNRYYHHRQNICLKEGADKK